MYKYLSNEMRGLREEIDFLNHYIWLQCEYKNSGAAAEVIEELKTAVLAAQERLAGMTGDPALKAAEPDGYEEITALSAGGNLPAKEIPDLEKKMLGALTGRLIGCMLGVPVEGWHYPELKKYAEDLGMPFPPVDYWTAVPNPEGVHYGVDRRTHYQKGCIDGAAVDDDVTYTLLGYQILKDYGPGFTTADIGEAWKKYLPVACTAEHETLQNLRAGIPADKAAEHHNPYVQWIGADIRADGFAWCAAGDPHLAAEYGYRDAFLSHRRNGIYGEMYFAAAEAAAFTVSDPMDALRIALNEIPAGCRLHEDLTWALSLCPSIHTWEEAAAAVDARFGEQARIHTNNNACLTVFGIYLGGRDFTKAVGGTVALGYDNDCTGATVGSIMGACLGIDGIPEYWHRDFHDVVRTYMNGKPEYRISRVAEDLCSMVRARLEKQNG